MPQYLPIVITGRDHEGLWCFNFNFDRPKKVEIPCEPRPFAFELTERDKFRNFQRQAIVFQVIRFEAVELVNRSP